MILAEEEQDLIGKFYSLACVDLDALVRQGRWGLQAAEVAQVLGNEADGRAELILHEFVEFLELFERGEFMEDVDVGVVDVPHLRKGYIGLILTYKTRYFFELLPDDEDKPQGLFFLRAEAVDLEQVLIVNQRECQQFEVIAYLLLPAPQKQSALCMQQRHVGVDLYLPALYFLDGFEHELAEVTALLLQEDLVNALIVH